MTFVAGVHGVGKTTCCKKIAVISGIQHYTASSIINYEKNSASLEYSKNVLNVSENQSYLVQGIKRILKSNSGNVILDGHFTVLDTTGKIVLIDDNIFAQLSIDSIVVYKDDPIKIYARLKERDGTCVGLQTIIAQQKAELIYSKQVATKLKIPIFILDAFDSDGLLELILYRS